ncbi:Eco57I restriction-modification methylase domain-containing protein [bacterium]|nr:Eco57I restriction-modification methylase domain-containing protein [bacterium]
MITFISPKKAVNAAFYRLPVLQAEMERLKNNFEIYLKFGKADESEEFHKNLIKKFLEDTFFSPDYAVNTNGREDLVIFNGNNVNSKPAVIIEAKSPTNLAEMFSENNRNCKALQECIYYFMQENLRFGNNEVKHIIITNYNDFYIFDAKDFSRFFLAKTNPIVEQFRKFEAGQLSDTKTSYFYEKCAKPAIERWIENENVIVTHFSKDDFAKYIKNGKDNGLIPLYKIFSPEHLLNKPFANDSNSLDKNFYEELLHIVGLEEVKESGKKVIRRKKESERDSASLVESAIYQLEEDILSEFERFETALRLVINWVNRLIFLKLVESQQLAYQKGNPEYKFLTIELVQNFDELNILFFKVLGRKPEKRDSEVKEKFRFVPYLNSSLFEQSDEEKLLQIRGIMNKPMKLFAHTVLKDDKGRKMSGNIDNLAYIFRFLDAYNFSSETEGGITQSTKTLINASVLGLIFEKINGYKDGSFFTPGFITEYMAKETIERAVVQKFNDVKGWNCETLDEIRDKIEDRKEADEIINSLRICDPAVGSGHFLVSVLNRILYIKSYLDILLDKNGMRIRRSDWELRLENDEISILDDEGNPFSYSVNSERQRVQETIFGEKRKIIENCLFGVDINPASVYICRLRLWIELLKNAYYTKESDFTQLETLPNIDINIKCGNSLVSRYSIKTGSSVLNEGNPDTRKLIKQYREAVAAYKNENNKENKRKVDTSIASIKRQIHGVAQLSLFDEELNKKILDDDIYANSLEWMIEFPEVLDDTGKFLGFDAVIGNPPYVNISNIKDEAAKQFYRAAYKTAKNKCDLYSIFTEKAKSLLKPNGLFGFIFSNTWLSIESFYPFREFLAKDVKVTKLVEIPEYIFANATVKTCICLYKNALPSENDIIEIEKCEQAKFNKKDFVLSYKQILENFNLSFTFEKEIKLDKVETVPLDTIATFSAGIKTANDDKFIFSEKKDGDCFLFLRGKSLKRWETPNNTEYIWYKPDLMSENVNARPRDKACFTVPKKIVIQDIAQEITATLDKQQYLCNDKVSIIYDTDEAYSMEFILALLNSKLINKWFKTVYPTGLKITINQLRTIPIHAVSPNEQKPIIDLVDKILAAKAADHNADTSADEHKIDLLVYHLYGLTFDEAKIIDPELNEEEFEAGK